MAIALSTVARSPAAPGPRHPKDGGMSAVACRTCGTTEGCEMHCDPRPVLEIVCKECGSPMSGEGRKAQGVALVPATSVGRTDKRRPGPPSGRGCDCCHVHHHHRVFCKDGEVEHGETLVARHPRCRELVGSELRHACSRLRVCRNAGGHGRVVLKPKCHVHVLLQRCDGRRGQRPARRSGPRRSGNLRSPCDATTPERSRRRPRAGGSTRSRSREDSQRARRP